MDYEAPVILSIYPNATGLGYVCLQLPNRLKGYGVTTAKPMSNRKLLTRMEAFIRYYRPNKIIIRSMVSSKNGIRNNKLMEAIATLSGEMGVEVFRYSRQQINDVFGILGADAKPEMLNLIIGHISPDLACRMPKERKWYEKEDYNMVMFDAAALCMAHIYLEE